MSLAALCLNGLLATLLLAALVMGVRLDRKLKGVRDGQAAFVLAVNELNAAASKAQAALADLRIATDEATDVLGSRITRAREAADRLEKLVNRSEAVTTRPARADYAEEPPARDVLAIERELRDATKNGGGLAALLARMDGAVEAPRVMRAPPARSRPAFRHAVDDDLFEDLGDRA